MMGKLLIFMIAVTAAWILVRADDQFAGKVQLSLGVDGHIILMDSVMHPPDHTYPSIHSSMVVQCFEDDEVLRSLLMDGKAKVIVHHGVPVVNADGYTRIYSHTETLPFFINKESGVEILSASDADKVLSGKVDNWEALGGNDIDIQIYGPQAKLNNDALLRIVKEAHGRSVDIEFAGVGNYEFMAEMVNNTEGGMAVGLRSEYASSEKLSNVDILLPTTDDGTLAYSIPIFVYVKQKDEDAHVIASNLFKLATERAKEDGHEYPLYDRLKHLDLLQD